MKKPFKVILFFFGIFLAIAYGFSCRYTLSISPLFSDSKGKLTVCINGDQILQEKDLFLLSNQQAHITSLNKDKIALTVKDKTFTFPLDDSDQTQSFFIPSTFKEFCDSLYELFFSKKILHCPFCSYKLKGDEDYCLNCEKRIRKESLFSKYFKKSPNPENLKKMNSQAEESLKRELERKKQLDAEWNESREKLARKEYLEKLERDRKPNPLLNYNNLQQKRNSETEDNQNSDQSENAQGTHFTY